MASSQAEQAQTASVRGMLGTLLPWSWLPIAGVLLGLVAAEMVAPREEEATSRARIGLTSEVVWPFYDATRERLAGRLDDDVRTESLAEVGAAAADVVSIVTDLPPDQAYLDIVVTAPDVELAARVAETVARRLVADDTDDIVAAQSDALAIAAGALERSEAEVAGYDSRIAELIEIQTGLSATNESDAAVDDELRALQIRRDQVLYSQSDLIRARDDATIAVDGAGEVALLSAATVSARVTDDGTMRRIIGVAAGGVVGSLLALGAAGRFGRVRDRWWASRVLGIPVEVVRAPDGDWTDAALLLARVGRSSGAVALVGPPSVTEPAFAGLERFEEAEARQAGDLAVKLPHIGSLGDLSDRLDFARRSAREPLGATVLVTNAKRLSLTGVHDDVRRLRADGRDVVAVLAVG